VPVSVIVPVKNEAQNLGRCLAHLGWADEVFVVDSQSSDDTARIAEEFRAKVVQFHFDGTYPKKKNWALESLPFANEWVLIVDADEVIPPELAREIAATLAAPGHEGYLLNFRYMFLGRWIRHCGYYPVWKLVLFKHRLGRFEKMPIASAANTGDNEVHEHVILRGSTGRLSHEVLHYPYPTIDSWVEKHNRYSNWEAALHERFLRGDAEDAGCRWRRVGSGGPSGSTCGSPSAGLSALSMPTSSAAASSTAGPGSRSASSCRSTISCRLRRFTNNG